ncbi:MAG: acyl carrier protein [Planctomycetales bacterium]|nr:acyl carrier protein [Planctomycetales bacterium]
MKDEIVNPPEQSAIEAATSDNLRAKICECLVGRVTRPLAGVGPTTSFAELGVDSLSFLELVVDIEKTFGVTLSPEDAMDFETIGDLENYIQQRRNSG